MGTRPLAALTSVALAVLGVVFMFPPDCAYACSCTGGMGSQKEVAEAALSDSDAVFSGEVVDIDRPSPFKSTAALETDTFRVSESWKGPEGGTLKVRTALMGMSCGYPFKEGQEYLVYAYEGKQGFEVDLCSQTKPFEKAGADLSVLGDGERPNGGGEVLTDTSGGGSVRAMVGVAGLVMAASLLVVVRLVRAG